MTCNHPSRRGQSLLSVVIASALLCTAMVAFFGTLRSSIRLQNVSETRLLTTRTALAVGELLALRAEPGSWTRKFDSDDPVFDMLCPQERTELIDAEVQLQADCTNLDPASSTLQLEITWKGRNARRSFHIERFVKLD